MAVYGLDFDAQVAEWVRQVKDAAEAVALEAAQATLTDAQLPVAQGGNMPVLTGNLRNSLAVGINTEPTERTPDFTARLAGFELGDTISARWTADYAAYVEYGTRGRPGRAFVRQAAQRWGQHVKAAEEKVRAALGL